jgi:hypothetical protein
MKKTISKFFLLSDVMGEVELKNCDTWEEAVSVASWDFANCGKKTLIRRDYSLVSETQKIINTDY